MSEKSKPSLTQSKVTSNFADDSQLKMQMKKNRQKQANVINQRCVVNKLVLHQLSTILQGMKLDPICLKKGHEKGRIQFICLEENCQAEKRLACAHCVIADHEEHVSNKITIEQYCEKFEANIKSFYLLLNKMEKIEYHSRLPDLQNIIANEIDQVQMFVNDYLETIKENLVSQIVQCSTFGSQAIVDYIKENQNLYEKISDYVAKNLFEMTPSEIENSLIILQPQFFDHLNLKFDVFEEQINHTFKELQAEWIIFKNQLMNNMKEYLQNCTTYQFDPQKQESKVNVKFQQHELYTPHQSVQRKSYLPNQQQLIQQSEQVNTITQENLAQSLEKNGPLNNQNNQNVKTLNDNYKKIDQKGMANQKGPISVKSSYKLEENLKKVQPSEPLEIDQKTLQKEIHKQIIGEKQQLEEYIQKQKKKEKFLPYNRYTSSCQHIPLCNTIPIFNCCQQAYPCPQCHDQQANHRAQISIPSLRYCIQCLDIINANCLTTMPLNCLKCQK